MINRIFPGVFHHARDLERLPADVPVTTSEVTGASPVVIWWPKDSLLLVLEFSQQQIESRRVLFPPHRQRELDLLVEQRARLAAWVNRQSDDQVLLACYPAEEFHD